MKKLFILLSILIPLISSAKGFIKPKSLNPGDKIAIISPASSPDSSYIESAIQIIKEWGYDPVVGENAYLKHGSFAGEDKQRLSDLKWAFENKDIKAIMCTRGGYGAIQELCYIPKGYFAKYPKWLIGYSDITAIHSAMATDGVMSIHSHMAQYLRDHNGTDTISGFLKQILKGENVKYTEKCTHPLNKMGKAEGILFGGNLAVLTGVGGTRIDYLAKGKNIILFIEDLNEKIEGVNRMLYRLKMAGILDNIKGLIVGNFKGYKPSEDFETMECLINSLVKDYNIPVVYHFPVGHVRDNYPLIEGAKVSFEVGPEITTLDFK